MADGLVAEEELGETEITELIGPSVHASKAELAPEPAADNAEDASPAEDELSPSPSGSNAE